MKQRVEGKVITLTAVHRQPQIDINRDRVEGKEKSNFFSEEIQSTARQKEQ